MNNYQKDLDDLIATLEAAAQTASAAPKKPKLLLHACCGPCSSYVLEYLTRYFQITVLYYNPNIYPREEYERRLAELKALYQKFPPVLEGAVQLVEQEYNPEDFYAAVGTREQPELATEPEKGERCRRCYQFRLRRAWEYAAANNFDYFCTTLSISPFKDAVKINEIGRELETAGAAQTASAARDGTTTVDGISTPRWLPSDFKKRGGFKRSLELSEEYNMYRQQYCGCVYSQNSNILKV